MEVLYIWLGGRPSMPTGTAYEKYLSYDEGGGGGPDTLIWSATGQQHSAPAEHLLNQGRHADWKEEVRTILARYRKDKHPFTPASEGWRQVAPQIAATFDLKAFGRLDSPIEEERNDARIARDMQSSAQKIVSRKAAFVFPAKWPAAIAPAATALTALLVKEVCAHFRAAPADMELPWTFLSMQTPSGGEGPLAEFIRALHHEMLGDTAKIDTAAWCRKAGPILLSGPTGSGKSYAARLLATTMKPGSRPVEINLAAVSKELLESRMRGYVPGAFTDAERKGRKSWFEEAAGGVLFLDEFQSVPDEVQLQLLDLLSAVSDDIYLARVGADHERVHYKVKVVLAINEDLGTLLRKGKLRQDLYYRIRFIQTFDPLWERLARDLDHRYLRGMLASYHWKSQDSIEALRTSEAGLRGIQRRFFPVLESAALSLLARQKWEGNFRELERVAFDIFQDYNEFAGEGSYRIGSKQVEPFLSVGPFASAGGTAGEASGGMTVREHEMLNSIQDALRESGFNISRTLQNQPYIKSRPTLRSYLRANVAQLAADVRGDSAMSRFLRL